MSRITADQHNFVADRLICRLPAKPYHLRVNLSVRFSHPALGKERFEMLAFAVSVLNGCESCIRSHEEVLRNAGLSTDKIHDLARLAAVVKALKALSVT